MSAQANIVAHDGAATPVQHTFIPVSSIGSADDWIGTWRENNSALPIVAQARITQKRSRLKGGITRCETAVEVPVMEAVAGQNSAGYTAAPKVAHIVKQAYITYASERATPLERRTARMILANVMNNITGTVTAAVVGVGSELHDSDIAAS